MSEFNSTEFATAYTAAATIGEWDELNFKEKSIKRLGSYWFFNMDSTKNKYEYFS